MATTAKLTPAEFDAMVECGAFNVLSPKKIELIDGELTFMNPSGPVHNDYIDYLNDWSVSVSGCNVRIQSTFNCGENRPEPDVAWFKRRRYGRVQPTEFDVVLIIEVADSSRDNDLDVKRLMYAQHNIPEYWVINIADSQIHVFYDSDGSDFQSSHIIRPPTRLHLNSNHPQHSTPKNFLKCVRR